MSDPKIVVRRGGDPSEEELAAITAAIEIVSSLEGRRPASAPDKAPPRWRFSGRWWSKPVPLRRARPW